MMDLKEIISHERLKELKEALLRFDPLEWLSFRAWLVAGAVTLFTIKLWRSKRQYSVWKNLGIPGPRPVLFYGNLFYFLKKGFLNSLPDCKETYGNICGVYVAGTPTLIVYDLDMLKDILVKKFVVFANRTPPAVAIRKPFSENMVFLRDDHWRHVRNTLSPTFSTGKLKKMMPAIQRVIQNLELVVKNKAKSGEMIELKKLCGQFAMDTIAGAAYGLQVDSLHNQDEPFVKHAMAFIQPGKLVLAILMFFPFIFTIFNKLNIDAVNRQAIHFFINTTNAAIQERRQEKKSYSDFLQLLVDSEMGKDAQTVEVDDEIDHREILQTKSSWTRKGLNSDEVQANAIAFLLGGYDTVATVMSFTLFALAANPECLRKVQQEVDEKVGKEAVTIAMASELSYLDMCMNEAMRLWPPGIVLDRQASEDVELGGYQIPQNARILVPVYSIHRDPELWNDPEKFDPERHTPEARATRHLCSFLPFGSGPRNCIGMRLAQLEIRMALASILQHSTPVLCQKSVYPPKLEQTTGLMLAVDGLWVKFEPRA